MAKCCYRRRDCVSAATNRSQYIDMALIDTPRATTTAFLAVSLSNQQRADDFMTPHSLRCSQPPRTAFQQSGQQNCQPEKQVRSTFLRVHSVSTLSAVWQERYCTLFASSSNFRPQAANHSQTFQTKRSSCPWGCTRNSLLPASHLSTSVRNCTTATSIMGRPCLGELLLERITAARDCRCCGGCNTAQRSRACRRPAKIRDLLRKIFL
jgi:hypothetical protein